MQGFAGGPRPGQVTLYSGICEVGPFHGKPLHHGTALVKVARNRASFRVVGWIGEETDEIMIDEYRHERGRWIWKEQSR